MIKVIEHPLIRTKLSVMRDKRTTDHVFCACLKEISSLMAYEVFKNEDLCDGEIIETPVGASLPSERLAKSIIIAPILRAGLGMVDGIRSLVPQAAVGFIGMARDEETLQPKEYFFKFPDIKNAKVVIVDPMLGTGGSLEAAIKDVKANGFNDIACVCLIAAPEGKKYIEDRFPDIDVFVASLDERMNENGFITPGLGDAGDRIFGTK